MITADDFNVMARTPGSIIIDVRSEEEYANKAKESWRNRGNIKGARSIPFNSFASRFKELDVYKNKPVFLYHFNNQPDVFEAARILTENGYTNVNVLIGGIWNLSWRAANIKNKKDINNWVENIPPENL
jgi:rhodanese-related sulfurtransferase